MVGTYRLNSERFSVRPEAFGGLLFCRSTFGVSVLAPLAAKVLLMCQEPVQEVSLRRAVAGDDSTLTDALNLFLAQMRDHEVLLASEGEAA